MVAQTSGLGAALALNPKHSGYIAGGEVPTAALSCVLRSGHTVEEKTDLLKQLWSLFQELTGIATDQLAISIQEIPSRPLATR